jgi:mannose-6-phosphate isomerase-like protein (cupin superfamily)
MQAEISRPNEAEEFPTEEQCYILELWNREYDDAVSVARARVEPGIATRPHSVGETIERYLIVKGSAIVHVEGLGPQTVKPGDLVLIPPGAVQWIENIGRRDLVFYAICTPRFKPEVYRDRRPG